MPFIKISPEQVMQYWDYIKDCIAESLPPYVLENSDSLLKIQEHLLIGSMECWLGIQGAETYAVAITQVVRDEAAGTLNLLIFSLNVLYQKSQHAWREGLEILKIYGRSKNCTNIVAYTNQPVVKDLVRLLGGNSDWSFLKFEL